MRIFQCVSLLALGKGLGDFAHYWFNVYWFNVIAASPSTTLRFEIYCPDGPAAPQAGVKTSPKSTTQTSAQER